MSIVSVHLKDRQVACSTLSGCVIDRFLLILFFYFPSMTLRSFLLLHSVKVIREMLYSLFPSSFFLGVCACVCVFFLRVTSINLYGKKHIEIPLRLNCWLSFNTWPQKNVRFKKDFLIIHF